jgi:ABC-type transport system involved in multi-copper enzyme maturation permease subunit
MTALLASELRRMSSRRIFRVIAGLGVLGIVVAALVVAAKSRHEVGIAVDRRFHLTGLTGALKGTSPVFVIVCWLLGASFIGADWHSGTVPTLLTWDPRRVRVILAKLVACVAAVFALVIALQAILGGALALAAALRGTTEGTGAAWVRQTVGVGIRVGALSSIGAAIGFAIASVARNSAAALGVGFGYIVIVENLIRGLRPHWERWLVGDNAAVFITGRNAGLSFERSVFEAGLLLAAYASALVVVAVTAFRARDVT